MLNVSLIVTYVPALALPTELPFTNKSLAMLLPVLLPCTMLMSPLELLEISTAPDTPLAESPVDTLGSPPTPLTADPPDTNTDPTAPHGKDMPPRTHKALDTPTDTPLVEPPLITNTAPLDADRLETTPIRTALPSELELLPLPTATSPYVPTAVEADCTDACQTHRPPAGKNSTQTPRHCPTVRAA
jgi:hypothetical protein